MSVPTLVVPAVIVPADIVPTVIVIAKAPVPGRVKTRCTPPCTPEQAADLALAALQDTLHTVAASSTHRRVIALDGEPGPWLPDGFEVIAQCAGSLGERLDHAFRSVGGPAFLIGMDTPQITSDVLEDALRALAADGVDSVVGPSADGGFWGLGLRDPFGDVCAGVPMSRDDTYRSLADVLALRQMSRVTLPTLVDVDDFDQALTVAAMVPGSGFASTIAAICADLTGAGVGG